MDKWLRIEADKKWSFPPADLVGNSKNEFTGELKLKAVELINSLPLGTEIQHVKEDYPYITVNKVVVTRYPADGDRLNIDHTVNLINKMFNVTRTLLE